jgi:hypothetical protein
VVRAAQAKANKKAALGAALWNFSDTRGVAKKTTCWVVRLAWEPPALGPRA